MKKLLLDKNLSGGAKIFYQTLWLTYGNQCEASNEELAKLFEISLKSVSRTIGELKESGWIEVEYKYAKNGSGRVIRKSIFSKEIERIQWRQS